MKQYNWPDGERNRQSAAANQANECKKRDAAQKHDAVTRTNATSGENERRRSRSGQTRERAQHDGGQGRKRDDDEATSSLKMLAANDGLVVEVQ